MALLVPVIVCGFLAGCSDETFKKRRMGTGGTGQVEGGGAPKAVVLSELESKGWCTVKGRFVAKDAPKQPLVAKMLDHTDRNVCLAGAPFEKQEQVWITGPDGGVANVVVWVTPAEDGKFFKIKDDLKKLPDALMDQPHCAFVPHVVAFFPKYQDKTGLKLTGQKLKVVNNAPIGHNFKTTTKNVLLGPGVSAEFVFDPEDEPFRAECSVHGWMNAYIWSFSHPYFAVTKMDGNFEFTAPAGARVNVMAWHEAKKTWQVETIEVGDGDTHDFGVISPR